MTNSSQPQLTPDPDNRDKSQFFVAGSFYVNRNDHRLFVEKRSGLGWTLNYAHTSAWWLAGGLFVFLSLTQLFFFVMYHSFINLVLFCLFLAFCLFLLIGYLRIRTFRQP